MGIESRNFTIMLNDIVGFTEKTSRMSRSSMMDMLQTHDTLIRPIIESFQGRIVKTLGDAFMSVFDSPTNAVLCAVKIQSTLRSHNEALPKEDQMHVRCALNAGEVQVAEDNDIFGEAVNVTARLEGVTGSGEIFITENVNLLINRNEVPRMKPEKKYRFKGISEEVQVYRVCQNNDEASSVNDNKAEKTISPAVYAVSIVLAIGIIAAVFILFKRSPAEKTLIDEPPIVETTAEPAKPLSAPEEEYKPQKFYIKNQSAPTKPAEPEPDSIGKSVLESVGTSGQTPTSKPAEPDDFKSVIQSTVPPAQN